jgi:hypothetical protein
LALASRLERIGRTTGDPGLVDAIRAGHPDAPAKEAGSESALAWLAKTFLTFFVRPFAHRRCSPAWNVLRQFACKTDVLFVDGVLPQGRLLKKCPVWAQEPRQGHRRRRLRRSRRRGAGAQRQRNAHCVKEFDHTRTDWLFAICWRRSNSGGEAYFALAVGVTAFDRTPVLPDAAPVGVPSAFRDIPARVSRVGFRPLASRTEKERNPAPRVMVVTHHCLPSWPVLRVTTSCSQGIVAAPLQQRRARLVVGREPLASNHLVDYIFG